MSLTKYITTAEGRKQTAADETNREIVGAVVFLGRDNGPGVVDGPGRDPVENSSVSR